MVFIYSNRIQYTDDTEIFHQETYLQINCVKGKHYLK